ncbi:A24 family peptidase, partial [Halobium palmae]
MIAAPPDLLRLLVVPVFAWAAWRDVRTRRLPNRVWAPLVVLGSIRGNPANITVRGDDDPVRV